MATLRDIKNRIIGVKNTQQITKAMKMVAAARLRRAQENIINARPYTRKISQVLSNLLSIEKDITHPLLMDRPAGHVSVVVVTSDRGLCGGFNMNAIKAAEGLIIDENSDLYKNGKVSLYCLGKKGNDYFTKKPFDVAGSYPGLFSKLKFDFASTFVSGITNKFLMGETDRVYIVFNEFRSVIQQKVVVEQLLPIKPEKSSEVLSTEYIFEPDKVSLIHSLLPKYLNSHMWRVLLESYAAELGARMTAMDMATENAKELIRTLSITYNKERQASITSEILEIVTGANALKEG